MKYLFSLVLFCLLQISAQAQLYEISGTVKNAKGEAMQAASVFGRGVIWSPQMTRLYAVLTWASHSAIASAIPVGVS